MDWNPGLQEHQLAVIEAVRSSDCIVRCIFTGTSSCFIEQTVNSDSRLLINHQCRIRIPSEFCILLQAEQFAHCKTPTYLESFSSKGTKFYQCTGLLSQVQEKLTWNTETHNTALTDNFSSCCFSAFSIIKSRPALFANKISYLPFLPSATNIAFPLTLGATSFNHLSRPRCLLCNA